jgi:hypothetical protein
MGIKSEVGKTTGVISKRKTLETSEWVEESKLAGKRPL